MHDGGADLARGFGRHGCAGRSNCHLPFSAFEFDEIRVLAWGLQQFTVTCRQGSNLYDFCFFG